MIGFNQNENIFSSEDDKLYSFKEDYSRLFPETANSLQDTSILANSFFPNSFYHYDNLADNDFQEIIFNPNSDKVNEINDMNKGSDEIEIKVKKGRKKKGSNIIGNHTKLSEDNISKRFRINFHKYIFNKINSEIERVFHNKKMLLKKLNLSKSNLNKVDVIKTFFGKTLKDIYLNDIAISNKYKKNNEAKHNKIVIEKLLNDENLEIREKFTKLFNLKFIDFLNHLSGNTTIKELEDFEELEDFLEKNFYKETVEYKEKLKEIIPKYVTMINNKQGRKRKLNRM